MVFRNVSQAKAELSALLARVERGEEVLIGKAGAPVAKLVPYRGKDSPRRPGALKGKIKIRADFDVLPPEVKKPFGIE
jgi:prevent-host-death family protein